ncbi:DUF397 domain-containing protein [Streptomyces sp. NPDC002225]|uniref:DUF397 domain-containing protein n=1 Tax=Streptomyces sp. NPDC002225 TaxID=3154413 RepID=UPI00332F556A
MAGRRRRLPGGLLGGAGRRAPATAAAGHAQGAARPGPALVRDGCPGRAAAPDRCAGPRRGGPGPGRRVRLGNGRPGLLGRPRRTVRARRHPDGAGVGLPRPHPGGRADRPRRGAAGRGPGDLVAGLLGPLPAPQPRDLVGPGRPPAPPRPRAPQRRRTLSVDAEHHRFHPVLLDGGERSAGRLGGRGDGQGGAGARARSLHPVRAPRPGGDRAPLRRPSRPPRTPRGPRRLRRRRCSPHRRGQDRTGRPRPRPGRHGEDERVPGGHGRPGPSPPDHRGAVPVRDSKNPGGPVLSVPASSFASFVAGVKAGEFGTV